jgi:hypothetical protein
LTRIDWAKLLIMQIPITPLELAMLAWLMLPSLLYKS